MTRYQWIPHGRRLTAVLVIGLGASCSCGPRTPLPTEKVEACTKILSCDKTASKTVSQCVWEQSQQLPAWDHMYISDSHQSFGLPLFANVALFECIRTSTCEDLHDCLAPISHCLPDGHGGDGCGLAYPGTTCMHDSGGTDRCGTRSCEGPANLSFLCTGTTATYCEHGVALDFNCADYFGDFCMIQNLGTPETACGVTLPSCKEPSCPPSDPGCDQRWCDGDDLIDCTYGKAMKVHCANSPVEATCDDQKCVPDTFGSCDPNTYADKCRGSELVYCDGEERSIDCRGLGFSSCGLVVEDNKTVARCQ